MRQKKTPSTDQFVTNFVQMNLKVLSYHGKRIVQSINVQQSMNTPRQEAIRPHSSPTKPFRPSTRQPFPAVSANADRPLWTQLKTAFVSKLEAFASTKLGSALDRVCETRRCRCRCRRQRTFCLARQRRLSRSNARFSWRTGHRQMGSIPT